MGIIEHDLEIVRPIVEVMRILGGSMLVKDDLLELLKGISDDETDDGQLEFILIVIFLETLVMFYYIAFLVIVVVIIMVVSYYYFRIQIPHYSSRCF